MEITKKLYWVDRVWYDKKTNSIIGDLAFTFQDAIETRTEDFDALKKDMTEYLGIDMDVWKEDIENGDFPIYEIYEGMFRDNCEDAEDWSNWYAILIDGTDKKVFTVAYCSEEFGKAHGIRADVYADPKEYL